ncbi:MAG: methyltransferase domain-containing protein [bacterium]
MPDLYATIGEVEKEVQERLADVLEMRAADDRQREMLESYLSEIDFPENSKVVEIGCGTGGVTRTLAQWPNVSIAVGVDPSKVFISKAKKLGEGIPNLSFEMGDGRVLPMEDQSFDVAIVHTTMCHVPNPESLLQEAFRILKPGGWFAVFDGDYATATVATGDFDPLESCISAFRDGFVHDQWLVRRLPSLIQSAGFDVTRTRSHGYVEAGKGGYMLSWIERGADVLKQTGRVGEDKAQALIDEAKRRSDNGEWFGHIAFASVLARKPA